MPSFPAVWYHETMRNEFKYIYEVYKNKSFSKAAKDLFLTQPTLSSAIKKTEQAMNIVIFDRSSQPLRLTPEGEVVIRYIEEQQKLDEKLKDDLTSLRDLDYGHIKLAGTSFFVSGMLSDIILAYSKQFPGIVIELTEDDSNTLYQSALTNSIDLILDAGTCDKMFHEEHLYNESILLAVHSSNPINERFRKNRLSKADILSNRHLEKDCPVIDLLAFQHENFILLKEGHDLHDRAFKMCHNAGFIPNHTLSVNQLTSAAAIAEKGLGICFLSDSIVKYGQIDPDLLCYYKINDPTAERPVFLAYPQNKLLSRADCAFIDTAKALYRQPSTDE